MRKRNILLGIAAVVLIALAATPFLLAPGQAAVNTAAVAPVPEAEQAAIIDGLRPPKRERPVIAIAAWNKATEISDFLSAYGILKRADVADVFVVAEKPEPIQLYITDLSVEPDTTMAEFESRYPEGADYVVVPAMDPGTDTFLAGWIRAQYQKGAKIISICNGSRMTGTAGLLDGRRATGHWSAIEELQKKYPTMTWVPDRRYTVDNGVATSTGITANIPIMIALVEAIGGRPAAERVAADLGIDNWDARHRSADFELTLEHKKTFIRNALTFWRRETVGVPVEEGVDELALGLLVDAYNRTNLATVVTVGNTVRSKHGLVIHPSQPSASASVRMLAPPPTEAPAQTLEQQLPEIVSRYDRATAGIVALVMEYPWVNAAH